MTHAPSPPNDENNWELLYQRTQLELDAILEITRAINNNASEESLYSMYKFTMRASLAIEKLALFVLDENNLWVCKVIFGQDRDFLPINFDDTSFAHIVNTTPTKELTLTNPKLASFEYIIPVLHKDQTLAYLLLDTRGDDAQMLALDTRFVRTLTNIIIVAIENKKLVRRQIKQEAFKKELEIAKSVQSLLFPQKLPYTPEVKIKATYFPHDLVGGDYYDYIALSEDKFIMCIADVSGKGIPAALLMSNFQASLRTLVRQTDNLKQIVEELNYLIYDTAQGEHFITFFICAYNRTKHTFTYINAGHNPAYFYDFNTNMTQMLEVGTTVLGYMRPLPFLIETTLNNIRNFFLFNYTDGVTEVVNPTSEQFGIDRLLEFLRTRKKNDLSDLHGQLISRINSFKKEMPFGDDITLLSARVSV